MKRITALLLTALLLLSLAACGGKDAWQEQYDLGMRYLNDGNYQEAVIAFEAAIEIDPKRSEAYLGAADAYVELGDYASARKILEDGLDATGNRKIQKRLDELATEDGNLTGQSAFTLQDLEDWGFPYGTDVYDLIASGAIYDEEGYETIQHWIDDVQQDPENWSYNFGGVLRSENPSIAVYRTRDMQLMSVTIENDDTFLGPRGLRLGMSAEEVLQLFLCDTQAAFDFAATQDTSLLDEHHSIELYFFLESNSNTDGRAPYYQGYLTLQDDGRTMIHYNVSDSNAGGITLVDLFVTIENDVVSEIRVDYAY
jgi:hypothetical protein